VGQIGSSELHRGRISSHSTLNQLAQVSLIVYFIYLFLRQGLALYPGLGSDLLSFCLSLLSVEIIDVYHHAWLIYVIKRGLSVVSEM
jgi:hypothetical protein